VLWLSGPPPDDLALALPRGSRRAPTAPATIAGLRLPARADAPEHGGVSMSMLGARTGALHAGFGILVDRAVEELRRTAGMSYAPQGSYELLDGRTANPYLYADCRAPDAPEVQRALVEILDDLAARGPTNAELQRDSDRLNEWITDDDARRSHLNFHARNHLLGVPAMSLEELRDERAALSADAVAATLADALKSLLVVGPARRAGAAGRELAAYELPQTPEQHGTRYVTTAQWRAFKLDVTVDLGEDGLTYRRSYKEGPDTPAVSVLFRDVVTAVRLASGGLTLISKTGTSLQLHGERLQDGAELLATVERKLGADRIVALSATERRVVDAVAAQIAAADASGLGGEIDRLPGMLGDREDLVCLAAARRDDQEGLVAVTTDRMLFLFDGADGLDGVQVQRGEATGVAVKGAIRKRLVIAHHDTTTTLHAFRPAAALAQTADLLRLPS